MLIQESKVVSFFSKVSHFRISIAFLPFILHWWDFFLRPDFSLPGLSFRGIVLHIFVLYRKVYQTPSVLLGKKKKKENLSFTPPSNLEKVIISIFNFKVIHVPNWSVRTNKSSEQLWHISKFLVIGAVSLTWSCGTQMFFSKVEGGKL